MKRSSRNRCETPIEMLEARRLLCESQDTMTEPTELRPDLYRANLIAEAQRMLAASPVYGVAASAVKTTATGAKTTTGGKTSTTPAAQGGAANIVWTNRATDTDGTNDTDGFGATYGTSAPLARAVVDAVITMYDRMIGSFNYSDGSTNYNLTLTSNVSGFGASASIGATLGGIPKNGTINMGTGNNSSDKNDVNGWFMDPTPFDNSEFMGSVVNEFSANAQTGSPANGKSDFLTVVAAEMTHCIGQFGSSLGLWSALTTNTNVSDAVVTGKLWVFRGPDIKHLMTSDNAGNQDFGSAVHSAEPQSLTYSGDTYQGTQDQGNAIYESSRRYIIDNIHALMFKDAFNYSSVDPSLYGNMYDVLNQTTGVVTLRGGDAVSGITNSNDIYSITRSGNTVTVSVDLGQDVAGSGALPGAGNLPAFVTQYDISQINSIVIQPGDGNDSITVAANLGVPVSIDGGTGTDTVTVTGSSAVDTLNINSAGVTGGSTAITITNVESMIVNAGDSDDLITFDGTGMVPTTINGENGNDSLTVSNLSGNGLTYNGGAGSDSLTLNGSNSADSYAVTATGITGSVPLPLSSIESFVLNANAGADNIILDPTFFNTVSIFGGDGNDSITVNNPGSAFMTLDGGNNTDTLTVNGTSVAETFNISGTGITGNTSIGTTSIESLALSAGGGDDAISVASTTTMSLSIDGGPGVEFVHFVGSSNADTYNVASDSTITGAVNLTHVQGTEGYNFDPGDGDDTVAIAAGALPATVAGGNGADSIIVNGTSAADTFNISGSQISGSVSITSISGVELLTVNAGDDSDNITFNGAGNLMATTINGEGGDDTLSISNATGASPVFIGGAGANVLTLLSGNYTVASDLGAGGTNVTANVSGIATMTFATSQHLAALNITGNALSKAAMTTGHDKVLVTNDLTITNNGQLDLNDNNMIVYYSGATPLASISDLIHSGRNSGNWNGGGIISTSAKNRASKNTTLGAIESSDFQFGPAFAGETIAGQAVLVKYTYYGDTNFNGKVDGGDYARMDIGFGQVLTGWVNGDFDGNGKVDGSDYGLADLAFGTQLEVL